MGELLNLLSLAESVERLASELYERYAQAFAQDEEAAFLFYRLSVEEKSHVALVKYIALTVEHGAPDPQGEPLEPKPLIALQAELSAEGMSPPAASLREAVQRALELEVLLGESYQKTRLASMGAGPARLVAGLDDRGHAAELVAFARRRGILPA